MATKRAAVPKVSAGMGMPQDIAQARKYVEPMLKTQQENLAEQERLGKELFGAQQKEAEATAARDIGVKEAEVRALEEGAKAERGLVEEYQQKIEKNPFPSYKPSQEDLTTYAQLGSMIATAGLLLGAGGKSSSKVAIGAMTGMLNGWRQGRKDLWDREARTFEKELQKVKAEHDSIRKDLEMGLKLAATDREAARAKLSAAAWKAGTNSVIASKINTGQFQSALDMAKKSGDLLMNIDKTVLDLAGKERARVDAAEQARLQREATIAAARIRAEAKGGAEKGGIGKVAEGKIEAKASLLKQYDSLIEDYEKNKDKYQLSPEVRTLFATIPYGGYASEKLMSIARSDPKTFPNEAALSQFIGKLETVVAPDRHSLYGANLTANELPRYERTIPKVTDDPEVFLNFLKTNRKSVEDSLRNSQEFYSRRGVDLKLNEIYDKAQSFVDTKNGVPKFNTVQEAEAANLPSGTKIIVGGKSAEVE